MKTAFACVGLAVFALWLLGALGVGQFILYYGKKGMTLQSKGGEQS